MNAPLRRRDRPCPKKCEPLQDVTVALDEGKPVDLPTEENHLALYCRYRVQNKNPTKPVAVDQLVRQRGHYIPSNLRFVRSIADELVVSAKDVDHYSPNS
jgi:hypothetical protein